MLRSKRLPNPKLKKPLKEYYDSYYNGQFLRNVGYLYNEFNYKS